MGFRQGVDGIRFTCIVSIYARLFPFQLTEAHTWLHLHDTNMRVVHGAGCGGHLYLMDLQPA